MTDIVDDHDYALALEPGLDLVRRAWPGFEGRDAVLDALVVDAGPISAASFALAGLARTPPSCKKPPICIQAPVSGTVRDNTSRPIRDTVPMTVGHPLA